MPATIFTRDLQEVYKFFKKYKEMIIKPIHSFSGNDIHLIKGKLNKKLVENFIKKHGHIMCQKFLSKIKFGDKRVFIINGKISGAISIVPKKHCSFLLESRYFPGSAYQAKWIKIYTSKQCVFHNEDDSANMSLEIIIDLTDVFCAKKLAFSGRTIIDKSTSSKLNALMTCCPTNPVEPVTRILGFFINY